MTRFIVVGAGIIGVSIAYRLAAAGNAVTILERDHIGAGTSGTSFAWTNSNEKTPHNYQQLNVFGLRAHRALENEFGARPWYHGGGAVEWRTDAKEAAELSERVERLVGWDYPAEWISTAELHRLEPALAADATGDARIAYFPEEGWVDPLVYAEYFVEKARALGAKVRRAEVTGVVLEGTTVKGVTTAAGETIEADFVVNCTGRWASDLSSDKRLQIPLAPTIGLLVVTKPAAAGVKRVIRTSGVNFRPDGAGRLMLQSEHDEPKFTLDSRPDETYPVAVEMIERAAKLYPDLAGVKPEAMRLALRAIPADQVSAVGPVPEISGYYAAVTHSGVTLAPWLGQVVAEELTGGKKTAILEHFRPARFF
ncbi:NAD(P)/FAD-dependent oxidoreductase [Kaistia granuli]|uniref:NAD(P)/FAD-dependent oxidoreductase n=1 Tax=Kaistia granuli TaxID=363259 RepID=UPI000374B9E9|nr:FAD-binding oxidoreductase [Kaistia granuli]